MGNFSLLLKHPKIALLWQIAKYGVIGVLATIINIAVAEVFAAYVWPCLTADDLFVRWGIFDLTDATWIVSDSVRATRAVWCNLVGFFVANVICWLLNRKFVFTPGRHFWLVEYAIFLAGSGFAILCGSAAIWALVKYQGMQTTYTFGINVLVSVAVNFVVRKFVVFKN
jgi:putative flippase GtrA